MSKARLLGSIAKFAVEQISKIGKAGMARISTRTAIDFATRSTDDIFRLVKENPLTALMVLWELGTAAAPHIEELLGAFPELEPTYRLLTETNDTIEGDEPLTDLAKYADEFETFKDAIAISGSVDRFLTLRRSFAIDEKVLALYFQLKMIKA